MELRIVLNHLLSFAVSYKELLVIILSPVIAVVIGEWLRARNHYKDQREDLVRRLLSYGYQMSPTYRSSKHDILQALNEIKYWYSKNHAIKNSTFTVMDKMSSGEDAQEEFIRLIQQIGGKEGHRLSREEVERVFSVKQD